MFNSKPLCLLYRVPHSFSLIDTRHNTIFPSEFQTTSILNRSVSRVNYVDYVLKGWEHFSHQCWMSRSTWAHFDVNAEGSASISCVHIIDTHLLKRERGNRGFSATVFYTKELLFVLRKGFCSRATQVCSPQSETQLKKFNRKNFTNTTPSLQQLDKNSIK